MDGVNPYAPPQAPLADGVSHPEPNADLPPWRLEGETLIVKNGAALPDVCLFSGEPTGSSQRLRLPLSWTPTWFRIAAVVAPMLAILAYSALRRTSEIGVSLGRAGRKRRRLGSLLTLGATVNGIVLVVAASGTRDGGSLAGLLLVSFVVLVVAAFSSRAFRIVKIDRRGTHLKLRQPAAQAFARLPAAPVPPG
jgi:hypothetical protein